MLCCPDSHLGRPGGVAWELLMGRSPWPFNTHVSVIEDVEADLEGSGVEGFNTRSLPEEAEAIARWLRAKAALVRGADPESASLFEAAADRVDKAPGPRQ